jgi:hypothetical protein
MSVGQNYFDQMTFRFFKVNLPFFAEAFETAVPPFSRCWPALKVIKLFYSLSLMLLKNKLERTPLAVIISLMGGRGTYASTHSKHTNKF